MSKIVFFRPSALYTVDNVAKQINPVYSGNKGVL